MTPVFSASAPSPAEPGPLCGLLESLPPPLLCFLALSLSLRLTGRRSRGFPFSSVWAGETDREPALLVALIYSVLPLHLGAQWVRTRAWEGRLLETGYYMSEEQGALPGRAMEQVVPHPPVPSPGASW